MKNLFTVNNVSKAYANHLALDDVSLEIPENSIFGLLGPNGAGKTTLIRIINQITAPDSGELLFYDEKLSQKHIGMIGYLPEERGLYKKMKVGEQAIYLAQLKGISKSTAKKRLQEWFDKLEIIGWWDKKVEELSKGMAQKVQFVTTIIHEPKLLIFDEPFSGFDPINVNVLKREILGLREKGATIIFSTHNMSSVEELCDDIALINKSKKVLGGSVKSIKDEYRQNRFEIKLSEMPMELETQLGQKYNVLETSKDNDLININLQLPSDCSSNQLLETCMAHSQVLGLKEILPSMNDIFIMKVGENNTL
ncbi:MAG: ABC transporter ATP-binding protein [Hyphomicrobiales bacterium]